MLDVSRVINLLTAKYLSAIEDVNNPRLPCCFSPSSLLTSIVAISGIVKIRKSFQEEISLKIDKILSDEHKMFRLIERIPKLSITDSRTAYQSLIRFLIKNHSESHNTEKFQKLAHTLGVEDDWVCCETAERTHEVLRDWVKKIIDRKDYDIMHLSSKLKSEHKMICTGNYLTMSAIWKYPFDPDRGCNKHFHSGIESTTEVKMMFLRSTLRVATISEFDVKVVEIPFQSPDLSAFVIYPSKKGTPISTLIRKYDSFFLDDCISLLNYEKVTLMLPKFKLNVRTSIIKTLEKMNIFEHETEESHYKGHHLHEYLQFMDLKINEHGLSTKFEHKTNFKSDDGNDDCMAVTHKVNRPFLFIIYDSYYRVPRVVTIVTNPVHREH